jgi:hypothetical protein
MRYSCVVLLLSCGVAWDASASTLDTDASFDVVVVDIWVDPRHEDALTFEVRAVHGAGDLTTISDPVDAEPCEHEPSENA